MKIGTTIRGYRLQKGLSQGDIEKRTGLLRCYLSRVENGHTVPSLDTLAKIAQALDLPLAQFFAEDSLGREMNTQKLADEELRFLTQIRSLLLQDLNEQLTMQAAARDGKEIRRNGYSLGRQASFFCGSPSGLTAPHAAALISRLPVFNGRGARDTGDAGCEERNRL